MPNLSCREMRVEAWLLGCTDRVDVWGPSPWQQGLRYVADQPGLAATRMAGPATDCPGRHRLMVSSTWDGNKTKDQPQRGRQDKAPTFTAAKNGGGQVALSDFIGTQVVKRVLTTAGVVVVVALTVVFWASPKHDIVSIHGDGVIQLNSKQITIAELGQHSFSRPVVIRTFADTAPKLMHDVIDALADAGVEADFEDGKYLGRRPDISE